MTIISVSAESKGCHRKKPKIFGTTTLRHAQSEPCIVVDPVIAIPRLDSDPFSSVPYVLVAHRACPPASSRSRFLPAYGASQFKTAAATPAGRVRVLPDEHDAEGLPEVVIAPVAEVKGSTVFVAPTKCCACMYCDDICNDSACKRCLLKRKTICERYQIHLGARKPTTPTVNDLSRMSRSVLRAMKRRSVFTPCEIRRHVQNTDCWVVAHGSVYDATPFLACHPAGPECILRKAGQDVSRDFDFHSRASQQGAWKALKIGDVIPCKGCLDSNLLPSRVKGGSLWHRVFSYFFRPN